MKVNLGQYRQCVCCGEGFYSVERSFVCSTDCNEQLETELYQDKLEELEQEWSELVQDYLVGEISHQEFKLGWNSKLYWAEKIQDLNFKDIATVKTRLMIEFEMDHDEI